MNEWRDKPCPHCGQQMWGTCDVVNQISMVRCLHCGEGYKVVFLRAMRDNGSNEALAGQMTKDVTVWCGLCYEHYQTSESTKKLAAQEIRKHGWKKTNRHGWCCPSCVQYRIV